MRALPGMRILMILPLYKVREFVNTRVLKLIYHAIFDCHLNCANTGWGQNKNSLNRLFLL